jgi:hypothetical protein
MTEKTTYYSDYREGIRDCPYRQTCSDNDRRCSSCANNPNRSYYVPDYYPYCPNPYPNYPWNPTITWY